MNATPTPACDRSQHSTFNSQLPMCVILVCPPKLRPSDEILRACHESNPHGAGVAWREHNRVYWRKNLKVGQVARLIREVNGEVVIHFRWASVGGVNPQLCHPFPVSRTA